MESMNLIQIKIITATQTWDLRHNILRPLQTIEDAKYSNDLDPESLHIGAILENSNIIGTATFFPESHPFLKAQINTFRLRGMAIDSPYQHTGLGSKILNYGIKQLQQKGAQVLWCNARESAFAFYLKNGFDFKGELFDIPTIGTHKVMYKQL